MRAIVVGLAALCALVACSNDDGYRGEGKVVEREYDDEDERWVPGYTIPGTRTCSGSPPRCVESPGITMPGHWDRDPERWLVTVEYGVADDDGNVKLRRKTVQVPESTYAECNVGRTLNIGEALCLPG
jgi:hypothetical protein